MHSIGSHWFIDSIPELSPQTYIFVEYYIVAEDYAGNSMRSPSAGSYSFATPVEESQRIPDRYTLNSPVINGSSIVIKYGIPVKSSVTLLLYDITGRLVKTLYQGEAKAGSYEINIPIATLNRGLYFVEMKAGKYRDIKKVVVVK